MQACHDAMHCLRIQYCRHAINISGSSASVSHASLEDRQHWSQLQVPRSQAPKPLHMAWPEADVHVVHSTVRVQKASKKEGRGGGGVGYGSLCKTKFTQGGDA